MNVRVIYRSRKGHTETIANEIAKHCETEALDITVPHTLGDTDLLFIGTGIYNGKPDELLMDYLDQLPVNKIRGAAIFCTAGKGVDGTGLMVSILEHKGITVYRQRFCCRGRWLWRSKGHPDEEDIKNAGEFADRVLRAFQG